jgi:hypothetical protein
MRLRKRTTNDYDHPDPSLFVLPVLYPVLLLIEEAASTVFWLILRYKGERNSILILTCTVLSIPSLSSIYLITTTTTTTTTTDVIPLVLHFYLTTTTTTKTMISARRQTMSKSNKNQMRAEREDTVRNYLPRFTHLNIKPRCLNYAPSRDDFKELFPEYLFCCKCVTVSNDFALSTKKNMDINSENYKCVANHSDFSYPTT